MLKTISNFFFLLFSLSSSLSVKAGIENQNYLSKVLGSRFVANHLIDNLPVIALNTIQQLTFHFDLKEDYPGYYNYTLVHCDEFWEPSDMVAEEYIEGYIEENITNGLYSRNTDIPYIHYAIELPSEHMKITKSGNYALIIYQDGDRNNVVLTRRFYVVEDLLKIEVEGVRGNTNENDLHQFRANIYTNGIASSSPNIEYSIRLIKHQNGYDEGIKMTPQFFGEEKITLQPFQNRTAAGNEFRVVDLRSFNQNGQGVFKMVRQDSMNHFILYPDKPRTESYSFYPDHNGGYFLRSENSWQSNETETEYAWAHFYLNYENMIDSGDVYIYGALTNWNILPEAKMKYKASSQKYVGDLLLKQGVYDYVYVFVPFDGDQKPSWTPIEGNYQQANNDYLILVYYQPFAANYQRLIGIKRFQYQN